MKTKQRNNSAKSHYRPLCRCLSANLSPPEDTVVKELFMLRCPELFLAGCTSAEPVSASFRHSKYKMNKINYPKINSAETQCG